MNCDKRIITRFF